LPRYSCVSALASTRTAERPAESQSAITPGPDAEAESTRVRLQALVASHHAFAWRTLRRLGVPEHDVDDAVQDAFLGAARRLGTVTVGREGAYLFGIVLRVAANRRRATARSREQLDDEVGGQEAPDPNAEQLLDHKRYRQLLDDILDGMELPLRSVFILHELDDFEMPEIAEMLEIPVGTVASRLRRARELFGLAIKRHQAQTAPRGGAR
jgi:RNA polymerase sigma-70 factor, ECF subfamily